MILYAFLLSMAMTAVHTPADKAFDHYVRKAYRLKDNAQFREAIVSLDSALALEPQEAQPYVLRAYCNYSLGNFSQAITDCSRAIQLNPRQDYPYLIRAFAISQQDVFTEMQGVLFHPDSIYKEGYTTRLEARYRVQYVADGVRIFDYARAISDLDKALEINPGCTACRHTRARLSKALGRYDLAMADMNRIIGEESDKAPYYVERALIHQARGEYRDAYHDLTTAAELEPNEPSHLLNRAVLRYEHLQDREGACRDFTKVKMLGGSVPSYAAECR
ncbi:MAG: tetratricopeptide repeat protein [Bacteroidetes bacterium]|nr:tetratricopeptide repeat protein [Bacteroidota bacterium]